MWHHMCDFALPHPEGSNPNILGTEPVLVAGHSAIGKLIDASAIPLLTVFLAKGGCRVYV